MSDQTPEEIWEGFRCLDCSIHTGEIEEYYMLHNKIWDSTGIGHNDGMLCIGCLENRLGRKVTKKDFIDCPLNEGIFGLSDRLKERLSGI